MLSERLGKWQLWLWVFGLNATFLSQHVLGVMGMPRRVYTYADNPGWMALNAFAGAGAVAMAVGTLVLLLNIWVSLRRGEKAGENPWEAFTLEWATSSPPPPENFAVIPEVSSRRPVWDLDHPDATDSQKNRHLLIVVGGQIRQSPVSGHSSPLRPCSFFCCWSLMSSFNTDLVGEITSASVLDVTRTAFFSVALLGSSFNPLESRGFSKVRKVCTVPLVAGLDHHVRCHFLSVVRR